MVGSWFYFNVDLEIWNSDYHGFGVTVGVGGGGQSGVPANVGYAIGVNVSVGEGGGVGVTPIQPL